MTEAERAAAYRAQVARRLANDRARYSRLAGSAPAALAVREAWQPLVDAINDAKGNHRGNEAC